MDREARVTDPNQQQPPILEPHLASWEIPSAQPQQSSWVVPGAVPQVSGWVLPNPVTVQPAYGWVYVGFWRRLWAYLIDGLILIVPTWLIAAPLVWSPFINAFFKLVLAPGAYTIDPGTGAYTPTPAAVAATASLIDKFGLQFDILFVVLFGLQALYFGLLWSRRGASLGQELLGIEVRHESDGSRISFKRGVLRVFGYIVSGLVLDIGFMWAAFDPRKQGWHDKIAATVVVKPSGPRTRSAPRWIVVLAIAALVAGAVGGSLFFSNLVAQLSQDTTPIVSAENEPPVGSIWFGESVDDNTFALSGRSTTFPRGESIAYVASLTRDVDNETITLHTIFAGKDRLVDSYNFGSSGDVLAETIESTVLDGSGQMTFEVEDSAGLVLAVSTITLQ
jgi:uncharacterized RDD family membrane protein YckC